MPPTPPSGVSPLVHLKRALSWNLARIVPSERESVALVEAGVTDSAVQRYAAWRRSLLLVALASTGVALLLAVLDALDRDFDELTWLGAGLELLWLLAAAALPVACWVGVRGWTSPGAGSKALRTGWLAAFLVPFVYALLPVAATQHIAALVEDGLNAGIADKLESLEEMALHFIASSGEYLLLLPAVLSLIPGAMNGCLRIKSLMPAAQLPGWLLVCSAPVFLLFWLVILVVANNAVQSPLLVLGVVLWAGSPIVYGLRGRVFVQSQIEERDAAQIARTKRVVGLVALGGIALMGTFVLTKQVAGLDVMGLDPEAAMSTKLDALTDADHEISLDDVGVAYGESKSFLYALDLSSFRFVIDFLAKLLLITAIFADLVLRATLAAWRNDRALRARTEASGHDAGAAALAAALSPAGPAKA